MKALRLGFDIDGVLADFRPALDARALERYGVVNTETRLQMEASILDKEDFSFWRRLKPLHEPGVGQWLYSSTPSYRYFITRRPPCTTPATQAWLRQYVVFSDSDILITGAVEKGDIVAGLFLDAYFDDDPIQCAQVTTKSPKTQVFLVSRPHNVWFDMNVWNREHNSRERIYRV